mmetsp:Transcript_56523/g.103326  ORF Transcript_56523/g.103326 Transcript_56523/m.103326 type:complete len:295 (-) Transcript_56523:111-995(-)
MAGRQRMLSQKMSKEFLLVAKGISTTDNKANMAATINLFNASLKKLMAGSSADLIPTPPTSAIQTQLNVVNSLWSTFSSLLLDNVDASTISTSVLTDVAEQSVPILVQMNAAVGMYATAAGTVAPGAVVNIAGRQRMLSQRMSKEALLVGLNVNKAATLTSLNATRNLFDTSHVGLRDGSTALNLPATSNTCILKQLTTVASIWSQFEPLIAAIISSEAATDAQLTEIATLNPDLLREANNAVTMYVKDAANEAITCTTTNSIVATTSGAVTGPRPYCVVATCAMILGLSFFLS